MFCINRRPSKNICRRTIVRGGSDDAKIITICKREIPLLDAYDLDEKVVIGDRSRNVRLPHKIRSVRELFYEFLSAKYANILTSGLCESGSFNRRFTDSSVTGSDKREDDILFCFIYLFILDQRIRYTYHPPKHDLT